ncbi:helix-turn-helix transcriptional regulator [Streptomyces sp. H10-C2]|uniref:helix-turn-helix domain-containing protein n=1 Tax=unclassified Streptomyces TaxID=2593676 RepID=UPI0024B89943|nr:MULTISPECIES: helix-turn-helix transcriptional regulator [unclassified Streptomyces]MDJ0344029.1 helix-turn-helix transcriptional regulator [Streptomyces sp. PH10-H1]MDJ0373480.1 helix-turn-helix transcriptional regulator [Streptomyces sp. H10-C2]
MPSSPSSSAQAGREAVAARLKEMRLDAGLTGLDLATRCGWHKAKSSRIENAKTPPSDADIRTWCHACGTEDQVADLIAASRTAESMYVEWRRKQRTGLRRLQESYIPLYERTRLFRVYSSDVVPGFLQTPGYATALLSSITEFRGIPNDVAAAVEARMARSHVIRDGDRCFVLLVEESVLRYRIGDHATMASQLGHLLSVMSLPSVSFGVIPFTTARRMWPLEACYIYDDRIVQVELLAADVTVRAPSEVGMYLKAFTELQQLAVYGAKARALITSAIDALG